MLTSAIAVALSGAALVNAQAKPVPGVTGALGNAAIVTDNPVGVTYTATLPDSNKTTIRGSVVASSNANGTGVDFTVDLTGLPDPSLGPFLYHIHDAPVPSNGNCTGTLAHLDPYKRGEMPPCYAADPASCQVGDLSGKHGNITGSSFHASYLDLYASTKAGIGAFFGNRSITIHSSNTTRLTCANFTLTSSSNSSSTSTTTGATSSPSPFTGGAASNLAGATAVVAVFVAGFAFLM